MILTGPRIANEVKEGRITIDPFEHARVNPNSYNLNIGSDILLYDTDVLDPAVDNPHHTERIPESGMLLESSRIYLVATHQRIGSSHFVPIVRARSSTARLGLFVHVTADLIDLGSLGRLTLQLHAVQRFRIYPFMELAQITFWVPHGKMALYNGKYQGATQAMASKSHEGWVAETRARNSTGAGPQ